jgi:phosphohistidine phosphatase
MAIDVWLLRHGDAEPHGSRSDAQRRLTEPGRDQARAAGQALAALGLKFDVVYSSPKVRAWDTAVLACSALETDPVEHQPLTGRVDPSEVKALLHAADSGRIMLVGHDPYLSQLVHDVTGARVRLSKGGIAGIRLLAAPGDLAVLLRPKEIALLARADA